MQGWNYNMNRNNIRKFLYKKPIEFGMTLKLSGYNRKIEKFLITRAQTC